MAVAENSETQNVTVTWREKPGNVIVDQKGKLGWKGNWSVTA